MYTVYVLNDRSIQVWPIYRLIIKEDSIDTVKFLIPRYYDSHDLYSGTWRMKLLSSSNVGEYVTLSASIFSSTHIAVDWVPRSAATASSGTLQFELECVLPDYLYQTHVAEIIVDSNLDLTNSIEFHPSVIATLLTELDDGITEANAAAEAAATSESNAQQYALESADAAQALYDSHFSVIEIDGDFLLKYTY